MSASSKKKLRSEQSAAELTERQLEERKQAKEVKFYTIGFAAVMAILVVVALLVGGQRMLANSGIREKKTVAYTVGQHQLNSVEMNYFFADTVNRFANQYGPYAALMGLDTTKPLNEQYVDEEKTKTWADDFMNSAKEAAKNVYVIYDEAVANGHKLSEEEMAQVDAAIDSVELYGQMSGTGSAKNYLKAVYGPGADLDTYRSYLETSMLADSYQAYMVEQQKFDDADLRAAEKENYNKYSAFSYNQYYLDAAKFQTGGTKDEEGNVTYSQEEKDAAAKAAKEALKPLTQAKTVEELDKAIADLEVNKDNVAASTPISNSQYEQIDAETAKWLADPARKAGDVTVIDNTSTVVNEEGKEVPTTYGYTVVMFGSVNENTDPLPNVRHILVGFEGGTTNENGITTYTDEEKAAAKQKAEDLLKTYNEGDKTEESFAKLATENTTDPGSKENGGLYENVFPGQMVTAFNDWCFAEGRKPGDTGIVETEYGYHVMYFSGESELSYRDLQITNELTAKAMEDWRNGLMEAAVTADGDTSRINTGLVLNR